MVISTIMFKRHLSARSLGQETAPLEHVDRPSLVRNLVVVTQIGLSLKLCLLSLVDVGQSDPTEKERMVLFQFGQCGMNTVGIGIKIFFRFSCVCARIFLQHTPVEHWCSLNVQDHVLEFYKLCPL